MSREAHYSTWEKLTQKIRRRIPMNRTTIKLTLAAVFTSLWVLTPQAIMAGSVVAWGWNWAGQTNVPAGLSGVAGIAAGADHTMSLKSDGTVVAWGNNTSGQTNVPLALSGVIAVAAGDNRYCRWRCP